MSKRVRCRGEVSTVTRVEVLEVRHQLLDYDLDVIGVVPPMRVVPVDQSQPGTDVERGDGHCVRREELRDPRVVAQAVLDDQLCLGQAAGIGRSRLVAMGIGVRVGNDAHDMGVLTADLAGDAPPEIFGRGHLDHRSPGGRRRATAGGGT